ncbi:MAG TPA: hypothetical protein VFV38_01635 [Ktedonobacteraceae bacterium]|nr:hypothetical protein [Ktedonobacteraceae bacterium]
MILFSVHLIVACFYACMIVATDSLMSPLSFSDIQLTPHSLFWAAITIMFLAHAIVTLVFAYHFDKKIVAAKDKFEPSYGFETYGLFEAVAQCLKYSGWVAAVGCVLAAIAACITIKLP